MAKLTKNEMNRPRLLDAPSSSFRQFMHRRLRPAPSLRAATMREAGVRRASTASLEGGRRFATSRGTSEQALFRHSGSRFPRPNTGGGGTRSGGDLSAPHWHEPGRRLEVQHLVPTMPSLASWDPAMAAQERRERQFRLSQQTATTTATTPPAGAARQQEHRPTPPSTAPPGAHANAAARSPTPPGSAPAPAAASSPLRVTTSLQRSTRLMHELNSSALGGGAGGERVSGGAPWLMMSESGSLAAQLGSGDGGGGSAAERPGGPGGGDLLAEMEVAERWLGALLESFVASHADRHAARRRGLEEVVRGGSELEALPAAERLEKAEALRALAGARDELAQLLARESDDSALGALLRLFGRGGGGSDEDGQGTALAKLGLAAAQLQEECGLGPEAVLQIYRTLYIFAFGFDEAVTGALQAAAAEGSPGAEQRWQQGVAGSGGGDSGASSSSQTLGEEEQAAVRAAMWRGYHIGVGLLVGGEFEEGGVSAQLQSLDAEAAALRAEEATVAAETARVAEEAATVRAEVGRLRRELAAEVEEGAKELDQQVTTLTTRRNGLLTVYQAQLTAATLRRFQLDESVTRRRQMAMLGDVFAVDASILR